MELAPPADPPLAADFLDAITELVDSGVDRACTFVSIDVLDSTPAAEPEGEDGAANGAGARHIIAVAHDGQGYLADDLSLASPGTASLLQTVQRLSSGLGLWACVLSRVEAEAPRGAGLFAANAATAFDWAGEQLVGGQPARRRLAACVKDSPFASEAEVLAVLERIGARGTVALVGDRPGRSTLAQLDVVSDPTDVRLPAPSRTAPFRAAWVTSLRQRLSAQYAVTLPLSIVLRNAPVVLTPSAKATAPPDASRGQLLAVRSLNGVPPEGLPVADEQPSAPVNGAEGGGEEEEEEEDGEDEADNDADDADREEEGDEVRGTVSGQAATGGQNGLAEDNGAELLPAVPGDANATGHRTRASHRQSPDATAAEMVDAAAGFYAEP